MLLYVAFTFQYGWQSFFPVGGLGVEDQQWPPRIPDLTACDYFFLLGWAKEEVHRSEQRTLDEMEQQIRDTCAAVSLVLYLMMLYCRIFESWRGERVQKSDQF
jgi:hypothetical protein